MKTLPEFVEEVNRLSKNNCDVINEPRLRLFRAVHIPLPASMLKFYFDNEYTPEQTISSILDQ
jgi:hypothetical protein